MGNSDRDDYKPTETRARNQMTPGAVDNPAVRPAQGAGGTLCRVAFRTDSAAVTQRSIYASWTQRENESNTMRDLSPPATVHTLGPSRQFFYLAQTGGPFPGHPPPGGAASAEGVASSRIFVRQSGLGPPGSGVVNVLYWDPTCRCEQPPPGADHKLDPRAGGERGPLPRNHGRALSSRGGAWSGHFSTWQEVPALRRNPLVPTEIITE